MFIEQPPKIFRWFYPHALWRIEPHRKVVFLTFDDGPIPEATPFILDTLDRFDVKATFFMVGDNAAKYPHLLDEVRMRGHQIGNHTYNHISGARHTPWTYLSRDYSRLLTADDVVNNVIRFTRSGCIITLHDSLKSIDKLKHALPEILAWLKKEGYEFGIIE